MGGREQLKRSPLQSLVEDRKPIAIPKQDFHPIAITIQEQEQVTRRWILVEDLLCSAHQAIEAVVHVRGRCTQKDTDMATAGAVALALLAGLVVSSWQAIRATRAERDLAVAHRAEVELHAKAEEDRVRAVEAER
jgi:hypothetical protein